MSSGTQNFPRRRSHSASSPVRALHSADDTKWRLATKRPRPSYPQSPSYRDLPGFGEPPEKWDVDQWRRGKRARRDTAVSSPHSACVCQPERTKAFPPALKGFPCTSAAFGLFPQRNDCKSSRTSHITFSRSEATCLREEDMVPEEDLSRLRSDAFGELQRSVAESGEGLVQRMRDWENSRSRSSASPPRTRGDRERYRRRRSVQSAWQTDMDANTFPHGDDEDEVEIVSGDVSLGSAPCHIQNLSHKKRAMSLGMMDIDLPEIEVHSSPFTSGESSERCSSPTNASAGFSTYSSDDEELSPVDSEDILPHSGTSSTPALTHTYTNSTNSSLISLPLSHTLSSPGESPFNSSAPFIFRNNGAQLRSKALHVPSSASRSEKALAALTLAMANGAGGLNDYAALLRQDESVADPALDQCQAGELWH
ncbi:uncharacterized protein LAESUDRAFT_743178 [Laetiporus sulphureus 93-53]|uniref:Uncharacterized protein n=1 Tax=Laetiporus sulphureus 93-53 TaxID=1314785 RepID=A0A165EE02_9APHY|nr:uncharacterized protein LAESUDRAFT_743178 [Laetiporus sulphureus 93-53]KZT06836.1 hypothetical protein LAESUDRAFT_743178 [Laetiporus sulphureus 93-53]